MDIEKYLRRTALPHIWCPGCGNGIIAAALCRAIDKKKLDPLKTVVVSGIGCSSRMVGYLNFNTVHTAHGRALTFATGIKLANPELNVIVVMGDGDATAIGGNHFIHTARRNIDMTVIVINNSIYGMTGGQYSPTTPEGAKATTAPYGTIERDFDIAKLAVAAGASYVARATAFHTVMATDLMVKGLDNRGFSVIEVLSQCPISYGRKNKMGPAYALLEWQRDNAVMVKAAEKLSAEQLAGKFLVGELHNDPAREYCDEYQKIVDKATGKGGK